jgi:hypothetical protein
LIVLAIIVFFILALLTKREKYEHEQRPDEGELFDEEDAVEGFRGRGRRGRGRDGRGRRGARPGRSWGRSRSYGYPHYYGPWAYNPVYYVDTDRCDCVNRYENCVNIETSRGKSLDVARDECAEPLKRCITADREGRPCP